MKRKIILFIIVFFLSIFLIGFILWETVFNPHRGVVKNFENSVSLSTKLTKEEALKDLDFVYAKLKERHPIWLEKTEEAIKIQKLIATEYHNKKEFFATKEFFTVTELYQQVSEILALMKDGHTRCSVYTNELLAVDDFTPLFAFGNPVAINGTDINQLYEVFKTRFSYEVDISIKNSFFSSYIFRNDILALIGIDTTKPVTFTYNTKFGFEDFTHNLIPHSESFYPSKEDVIAFLQSKNYSQKEIDSISDSTMVEYLAPNKVESATIEGNPQSWIWYTIDSKNDVAIFTFKQCNYNDEYIETVKKFFADVKKTNINNVAVDLRGNGGGNSNVANEFIRHLNIDSYKIWDCAVRAGPILKYYRKGYNTNKKYDTNFSGNVYILTNTQTYSAAMDFAMLIQDNNLGKIVGQPSSNKPESYGDILFFQLPNSKLQLCISFKKWYRIDQTKKDLLIEPDIPCPANEAVSVLYDLIKL